MKRETIAWCVLAASILIVLAGAFLPDDLVVLYFIEPIVEPVCCWIPALLLSGTIVTSQNYKSRR
ncbi:MAG: hypothetical protein OXF50_03235 [Caldilineaceae bacterium]|nr:hypothetical protein [Caldilineaceae bacterium]